MSSSIAHTMIGDTITPMSGLFDMMNNRVSLAVYYYKPCCLYKWSAFINTGVQIFALNNNDVFGSPSYLWSNGIKTKVPSEMVLSYLSAYSPEEELNLIRHLTKKIN